MATKRKALKLQAGLGDEKEPSKYFNPSTDDASVGINKNKKKKRQQRESRVDDSIKRKTGAVENLCEMSLLQLREQAILRGVSPSGSKSELIDSLCAAEPGKGLKKVTSAVAEKEGGEEACKEEKQVKKKEKRTAVLDSYIPDHIKTEYHVLEEGDDIYDAMLNQTNVGDNTNKFFAIQALESNDGSKFLTYTRWGRVGIKGQDKLQGPYRSRDAAIQEFEAKFLAKTKNNWSDRKQFVCHPKCYTLLEIDYDKNQNLDIQESIIPSFESQLHGTKLDPRTAKFITLICNPEMMKQRMLELGYNAEKLPLGKLSKSTILKGYDVLKRISDIIGTSDREKLQQLSGEFYTIIPHDFGFRKMRDFTLDTHYKLKCKLEMVEALGEIVVANSLIKDDIYTQEDPLYSHYRCLRCELVPLEVSSKEFSMIDKYIHNTGDETHYRIDVVQIFRASREGENERYKKFSHIKNRMLLWHGSRLTNWTGILSQGLRIAPPEAPSKGYTFGKGLYFADMFAKSAPYCGADWINSDAVLVLCEIALGDLNEIRAFNYHDHKLPKGKLSAKAIGRIAPDSSEVQVLEDGVVVPLGKPIEQQGIQAVCGMNEYIIFDEAQIQIRYVVHVKFCYRGCESNQEKPVESH